MKKNNNDNLTSYNDLPQEIRKYIISFTAFENLFKIRKVNKETLNFTKLEFILDPNKTIFFVNKSLEAYFGKNIDRENIQPHKEIEFISRFLKNQKELYKTFANPINPKQNFEKAKFLIGFVKSSLTHHLQNSEDTQLREKLELLKIAFEFIEERLNSEKPNINAFLKSEVKDKLISYINNNNSAYLSKIFLSILITDYAYQASSNPSPDIAEKIQREISGYISKLNAQIYVDMRYCQLIRFNFSSMNISGFDFSNSTLTASNFSQSKSIGSVFYNACLRNANFKKAKLDSSNLSKSKLSGADFKDAHMLNITLELDRILYINLSSEFLRLI